MTIPLRFDVILLLLVVRTTPTFHYLTFCHGRCYPGLPHIPTFYSPLLHLPSDCSVRLLVVIYLFPTPLLFTVVALLFIYRTLPKPHCLPPPVDGFTVAPAAVPILPHTCPYTTFTHYPFIAITWLFMTHVAFGLCPVTADADVAFDSDTRPAVVWTFHCPSLFPRFDCTTFLTFCSNVQDSPPFVLRFPLTPI